MSGQRIVVKFGTKLLCRGGERLDTAILVDEFTRRGYPDPRAAA